MRLLEENWPARVTPDPVYLGAKLEEVEQDEPQASPLDEVVSVEENQALTSMQSSLDAQGHIKITKAKSKGEMPTSTEGLRQKLKIEGNTWLMIAAKCRHKEYLKDLVMKDFDDLANFLLGDKVMGLQVSTPDGNKVRLDPPLTIVLSYEFALRSEAYRRALEEECATAPHTFSKALKEVIKDTEIKELYFTSPITLSPAVSATKRAHGHIQQSQPDDAPAGVSKRQKKKMPKAEKGGSKGHSSRDTAGASGESWNKSGKFQLVQKTSDGKSLCYRYNNKDTCKVRNCPYVHACRVKGCQLLHPMTSHPGWC